MKSNYLSPIYLSSISIYYLSYIHVPIIYHLYMWVSQNIVESKIY